MSTNAKEAKFRKQLVVLEQHKEEMLKPEDQRDPKKLMALVIGFASDCVVDFVAAPEPITESLGFVESA